MAKVAQEIDRLFELPLEEFIAARNELARLLKSEGSAAVAEEIKQLAKPNVAAWTINQLSRQNKDAVKVLLDAAAKLRKAQERALQSGGSGDALLRAQAEERQAIRELTGQAREILQSASRPASSTVLNRIASTLRAAAISDQGRSALRAGRLTGEVTSAGFEALAGFETSAEPERRTVPTRDELAERRRQKEELQRKRRDVKERVRKAEARATDAERAAERAEKAAIAARRTAAKSRREADEAAAELEELHQ